MLIDELWLGEPPDGAATTLRSYLSRLRKALGEAAPIRRTQAGYTLALDRERVDVARFEALVRQGRELAQRSRHRRAAAVLRDALALWRGEPFAGLSADGALRAESSRLEALRLDGIEIQFEADLDLGRDAELIDELERALAEHPLRERLWRHLMLALYRAGRQADALLAYHRARAALDEQLGIEPSEELRALEAAILRQDVPAPAAQGEESAKELPASLTSFVGRRRELDDVGQLLQRSRLVTLVGVGGVGKTRLALEAARLAAAAADNVAFVDLTPISDAALVPRHVAAALGVVDQPGRSQQEALVDQLRSADLLLVLDNCEHVREVVGDLAQSMLTSSPYLRVLATSREVLDVPGEAVYPVPPLGLPAVGDIEAVRQSEAVRLLIDRARLTRRELQVDDEAYATAARICSELDGLPLAIELAAARARVFSLDEIAERLRDRFQFLVSWRRLTPARHQTLREAMDWSYELLAPDEQRLLGRVSVFPAGATLDSIAAVCLEGDDAEAQRLVGRLVDASLLAPIVGEHGTRYRLLETVRQYGAKQLPESELAALQRRHAERARAIAESTNMGLEAVRHASAFGVAREELPSIRSAIAWAGTVDPTLGTEIACALERFWAISHPREGIAMFTALLEADELADLPRARALRCRGGCRYSTGDFDGGVADYEQALAIHRRLGQNEYVAHLLMRLAIEASRVEDGRRARVLLDEAAAIGGDTRFAPDHYVGLELASDLAFDDGRDDEAFEMLEQAAALAAAAGDVMWQCNSLGRLAEQALDRGRVEGADEAARQALRLARDMNDRQGTIWGLALLARHATDTGRHRRAGRIWGGLEAEVQRGGPVGQWELQADAFRQKVAVHAGEEFDHGVREGRSLALDAVIQVALSPA